MPKLPDRTDLGPLGSYRSPRQYLTAGEVDMGGIGRGLQKAGNVATEIGLDMQREQAVEDLDKANLYQVTHGGQHERSFDNDPNYNDFELRYKPAASTISDDAAKLIRNPVARQKWREAQEIKNEETWGKLATQGQKLAQEDKLVKLSDRLGEWRDLYSDPQNNDLARDVIQDKAFQSIDGAVAVGTISRSQGQKMREEYLKGSHLKYAETLLASDPDKLVTDLDELNKQGPYKPFDPKTEEGAFKPSIAPNNSNKGLATITAAKSGAKVHVSEKYADRFAGLIEELEAKGIEISPDMAETGGYNNRNIKGTNVKSRHAFGEAIDVNASGNAQGDASGGALAKALGGADKVRELAAKYHLKWGGDFKKNPDPMHFEVDHSVKSEKKGVQVAAANTGAITDAGEAPVSRETPVQRMLGRLDPEQRAKLLAEAQRKVAARKEGDFYDSKFLLDGVLGQVEMFGAPPKGTDVQGALTKMAASGQRAYVGEYTHKLKVAREVYDAGFFNHQPISWLLPSELQDNLEKVQPKADDKPETFAARKEAFDKVEKRTQAILEAREKDPAALAEGDPTQGWPAHPAVAAAEGLINKMRFASAQNAQDAALAPAGQPQLQIPNVKNVKGTWFTGDKLVDANAAPAPDTLVLDQTKINVIRAEASIDAQRAMGIPEGKIRPITKKRGEELLDIPNPNVIPQQEMDNRLKAAAARFTKEYGPRIGGLAFTQAVTDNLKNDDWRKAGAAFIAKLAGGREPTMADIERVRFSQRNARFKDLLDGTAAAIKDPQPYTAQGILKREPTDEEIRAMRANPDKQALYDRMFGFGTTARALAGISLRLDEDKSKPKLLAPPQ